MKRVVFIGILIFSINFVSGQFVLPKITTTRDKVFKDFAEGISNENWFLVNENNIKAYSIIFKNTPVGIKHALDKFNELTSSNNIVDESVISDVAIKSNKEYDLDLLSITIRNESSEIKKYVKIDDAKVSGVFLKSNSDGRMSFLSIFIYLK